LARGFGRVALRFELVRPAVTVVRVARRDERVGGRAMAIEAGGLKIRPVRSADLGTFVPVRPSHHRLSGMPVTMSADERSMSVSSIRSTKTPP
jgi:hypothetical protein